MKDRILRKNHIFCTLMLMIFFSCSQSEIFYISEKNYLNSDLDFSYLKKIDTSGCYNKIYDYTEINKAIAGNIKNNIYDLYDTENLQPLGTLLFHDRKFIIDNNFYWIEEAPSTIYNRLLSSIKDSNAVVECFAPFQYLANSNFKGSYYESLTNHTFSSSQIESILINADYLKISKLKDNNTFTITTVKNQSRNIFSFIIAEISNSIFQELNGKYEILLIDATLNYSFIEKNKYPVPFWFMRNLIYGIMDEANTSTS
ncbi:MAG: hypothetical protein JXR63_09450 [Spirochaetales bacterium]|nr:hypothetical protein [Spirochaetales bacterium]